MNEMGIPTDGRHSESWNVMVVESKTNGRCNYSHSKVARSRCDYAVEALNFIAKLDGVWPEFELPGEVKPQASRRKASLMLGIRTALPST